MLTPAACTSILYLFTAQHPFPGRRARKCDPHNRFFLPRASPWNRRILQFERKPVRSSRNQRLVPAFVRARTAKTVGVGIAHVWNTCTPPVACGHIIYGPALGPDCSVMNGPARVR